MYNKKLSLIFREIYNPQIENWEEGILILKNNGASQMECVKIIKKELNVSLEKADEIVLHSKAWTEDKSFITEFRNNIADVLENIDLSDLQENKESDK